MKNVILLILLILALMLTACGCQGQQVWDSGGPPLEWRELFGNDNVSRFLFAQNQVVNNQAEAIKSLDERMNDLREKYILMNPNDLTLQQKVFGLEKALDTVAEQVAKNIISLPNPGLQKKLMALFDAIERNGKDILNIKNEIEKAKLKKIFKDTTGYEPSD